MQTSSVLVNVADPTPPPWAVAPPPDEYDYELEIDPPDYFHANDGAYSAAAALRVQPTKAPRSPMDRLACRPTGMAAANTFAGESTAAGHEASRAVAPKNLDALLSSTRARKEDRAARQRCKEAEKLKQYQSNLDPSAVAAAFSLIDKNGDGFLSRIEVIKAVRGSQSVRDLLGLGPVVRQEDGTRDQFEAIFQRLDADEDKAVSFDEFLAAFRGEAPLPPPPLPGLADNAELIAFTLDDVPLFVRTVFNGARCLDGIHLPASLAAVYDEMADALMADAAESSHHPRYRTEQPRSSNGGLAGKYAYGMRRDNFRPLAAPLSRAGSELWAPSEPRAGSAAGLSPPQLERASSAHSHSPSGLPSQGAGSQASEVDAKWYRANAELMGRRGGAPAYHATYFGAADDEEEAGLPECLKLAMLTSRRAVQQLFLRWESAGTRTVPLDELLGGLQRVCPTIAFSREDVAAIVRLAPPQRPSPLGRQTTTGHLPGGKPTRKPSKEAVEVGCHQLWRLLASHAARERSQYIRSAVAGNLSPRPVTNVPIEVTTRSEIVAPAWHDPNVPALGRRDSAESGQA